MFREEAVIALLLQVSEINSGSCSKVAAAAIDTFVKRMHIQTADVPLQMLSDRVKVVTKEYKEFSKSRESKFGFYNIPENVWFYTPFIKQKAYRVDMLYYFWMANQDM